MLVEKEVIRPGTYFYRDEATGTPRKLVVTPELCKHWHDQGNKMLGAGLTVPVPFEHDFDAHPMTPADKLKNNSGWVQNYQLKDITDPKTKQVIKDVLFSAVDVTDPEVAKKLPHTVRWTSPWINSFTDGDGREWNNVISHLALTTRPRVINQQPFPNIAAALSMAEEGMPKNGKGFYLSRAGRLKSDGKPIYPIAFSMLAIGMDKKPKPNDVADGKDTDNDLEDTDDDNVPDNLEEDEDGDDTPDVMESGEVGMEELLCDLLQALGVPMPDESNEQEFKMHLYEAVMSKIKELTSEGMGKDKFKPDQNKPPNQQPNASQAKPNPLIQQEQQPMYMSLEEIQKLPEGATRSIALAMYSENEKLRAEMAASTKTANSLRDAKLKEENDKRTHRVQVLGRLSPHAKPSLDAMMANPAMALSLGDNGHVVDPMATTLEVLEKGLADLPRLLTTPASVLSIQPQPQDADALTQERIDELADGMARKMGAPPQAKAS